MSSHEMFQVPIWLLLHFRNTFRLSHFPFLEYRVSSGSWEQNQMGKLVREEALEIEWGRERGSGKKFRHCAPLKTGKRLEGERKLGKDRERERERERWENEKWVRKEGGGTDWMSEWEKWMKQRHISSERGTEKTAEGRSEKRERGQQQFDVKKKDLRTSQTSTSKYWPAKWMCFLVARAIPQPGGPKLQFLS